MDDTQAPDATPEATPEATPGAGAPDPLPVQGSAPGPDVPPAAPVGQAPAGQTPADHASASQTPADHTPADQAPADQAPADPRVAAALDRLTSLDDLTVDDHVAVYDAAHRDLQEALDEAASRDTTDPA